MIPERRFLIDIDDGTEVFVLLLTFEEQDKDDILDEVYEIVSGHLDLNNVEYTFFNVIDITNVKEVRLS
jgi:hypothetical protein